MRIFLGKLVINFLRIRDSWYIRLKTKDGCTDIHPLSSTLCWLIWRPQVEGEVYIQTRWECIQRPSVWDRSSIEESEGNFEILLLNYEAFSIAHHIHFASRNHPAIIPQPSRNHLASTRRWSLRWSPNSQQIAGLPHSIYTGHSIFVWSPLSVASTHDLFQSYEKIQLVELSRGNPKPVLRALDLRCRWGEGCICTTTIPTSPPHN